MSSNKPIGGYFELELNGNGKTGHYHPDLLRLNTGRNCLEYILKANKVKHIYLPKYTCAALLEPVRKINVEYSFYSINKDFEITETLELNKDDYLLYINYFGLKDKYCKKLASIYGNNIILDYSQSFYTLPQKNAHTFYSPRKFFGLSDGGLLNTKAKLDISFEKDLSFRRFSHLLERIDVGAEMGYDDFKKNENSLSNQSIKSMSSLSEYILSNIKYNQIKKKRWKNFKYLHKELGKENKITIKIKSNACPLCYPYYSEDPLIRKKLIEEKIFVPTYWPNVLEDCRKEEVEYELAKNIIPLPIDQRYCIEDMYKIIKKINAN